MVNELSVKYFLHFAIHFMKQFNSIKEKYGQIWLIILIIQKIFL